MAYYQPHPVFEAPEDENACIWRYMSFSKFFSLIHYGALYFTVANKFDDRWEGTLPIKNKENMDVRIISFFEQARSTNAINCWHQRECESSSMWKIYATHNEGVAIKTTYSRLTKCFLDKEGTITYKLPVHIGKVKYIDFSAEKHNWSNAYTPLLFKRDYFIDENEIRAIIGGGILDTLFMQGLHGVNVPVDLSILIESIYVDPVAFDWFFELVKSIVGDKFEVKRSSIGQEPPKTSNGPPVRAYTAVKKAGKDWEIL